MKKILSLMLALALTVGMFTACKGDNGGDGGAEAMYPGTPGNDSITIDLETEPPEMCTITTTDTSSMNVIRQCIVNLVTLDQNDDVAPGVAESWEYDEETLTYTFHLREMNWSNGTPVTAYDFEFAWTSLLTPAFASDYAYFGYIIKNGEAFYKGEVDASELGIEVVDEYTLKLTLEQPTAYALTMLAFPSFAPVNEEFYMQYEDAYATDADKMLTNGPYNITTWDHEVQIVLEKNEDFYDAANVAKIQKVVFVMYTDRNTALNEFRTNGLDMTRVDGTQATELNEEGWTVNTYDNGAVWYILYNMNRPGTQNVKIRQAMTMAVDTTGLVTNVRKDSSTPATSFTPPAVGVAGLENVKFNDMVGDVLSYDPEAAKALFEEGLAEEGLTVETFKPTIICSDANTTQRDVTYIQEQWRTNLGLEVTVAAMPFKSRIEAMSSHDFDLVFAGWSPDYNDPNTYLDMFVTGGGNNHPEYSSEEYDALIKAAATETDPEARAQLLVDAEKVLLADMPMGPLFYDARDYITSGKVKGIHRSAFQDLNLWWAYIEE